MKLLCRYKGVREKPRCPTHTNLHPKKHVVGCIPLARLEDHLIHPENKNMIIQAFLDSTNALAGTATASSSDTSLERSSGGLPGSPHSKERRPKPKLSWPVHALENRY